MSHDSNVGDEIPYQKITQQSREDIEMCLARTVDRRLQSYLMNTFIICVIYYETVEYVMQWLLVDEIGTSGSKSSAQPFFLACVVLLVLISVAQLILLSKPLAEYDKREAHIVLGPQPMDSRPRQRGNLPPRQQLHPSTEAGGSTSTSPVADENVDSVPKGSAINTDRVPFNIFPNVKDPRLLLKWYRGSCFAFVVVMSLFVWSRQLLSPHLYMTYLVIMPVLAGILLASDNWNKLVNTYCGFISVHIASWAISLAISKQPTSPVPLTRQNPYGDVRVVVMQALPICFLIERLMRSFFLVRKESHFKEATLLLRNASINAINEQVGSLWWLMGRDRKLAFCRGSIWREMGNDPADIEGKFLLDSFSKMNVSEEQQDLILRMHAQVLETGENVQYQVFSSQEKDIAQQKILQVSLRPFKNELHKVIGVLGVATDVTMLQQLVDRLRVNEQRYKTVVDNMSDVIVQVDQNLNIEFSNVCCGSMGPGELRGKSVSVLFNQLCILRKASHSPLPSSPCETHAHRVEQALQDKIMRLLNEAIQESEPRHFDYACLYSKGEGLVSTLVDAMSPDQLHVCTLEEETHFFSVLINPLSHEDQSGAVVTIRDTTSQRRELEQERRVEELRLRSAWKAEQYASLNHEIKNPLQAIWLGLQLLATTQNLSQQQLGYIQDCSDNAMQLLAILNSSLDLERLDWGKPVPLVLSANNIVDLVETCVDMMSAQANSKSMDLQAFVATKDIPLLLFCDRTRVTQIISNLISNAIKFSPKNGAIIVCVQSEGIRVSEEDSSARIATIRISVADRGKGIMKADLEKLFTAFKQVDAARRPNEAGHGLGLSVVKYLAEQMNGRVEVQSEYGVGSTFTAILDMKLVIPQPIQYVSLLLEQSSFDTVMLLEVNPQIRDGLVQYIKDLGVTNIELFSEVDLNDKNLLERVFRDMLQSLAQREEKAMVMLCVAFSWLSSVFNEVKALPGGNGIKLVIMVNQTTKSLMNEFVENDSVALLKKPVRLSRLVSVLAGKDASAETLERSQTMNDRALAGIGHVENAIESTTRAFQQRLEASPPPGSPVKPATPPATQQGAILIAEDVEVNRRLLVHLLKKLGYEKVVAAENGRDAMDYLQGKKSVAEFDVESPQEIAIVLLDAMMPELSGPETLVAIRALEDPKLRQLPCIAVSASVDFPFLQLGFAAVIPKPVLINQLAKTLSKYVAPSKPFETVAAALQPIFNKPLQ